jgi:hypothetical protein
MSKFDQEKAEGSREVIERELARMEEPSGEKSSKASAEERPSNTEKENMDTTRGLP